MILQFFTLVLHELDIRGSYLGHEEFPVALDSLAEGRVDVESLITHEVGLDDVVSKGFQLLEASNTGAVKVLVNVIENAQRAHSPQLCAGSFNSP